MLASKNSRDWEILLEQTSQVTDEGIQLKFPGAGILILSSLPGFLQDLPSRESGKEPKSSIPQDHQYQVFLAEMKVVEGHRTKLLVSQTPAMNGRL